MGDYADFWWDHQIISVEKLHELASDQRLREIWLRCTVKGYEIGAKDREREFSQWELQYKSGERVYVYV